MRVREVLLIGAGIVFFGVIAFLVMRDEPRDPRTSLEATMASVVPSDATELTATTWDATTFDVTGKKTFKTKIGWSEYQRWVRSSLGSEWKIVDAGQGSVLEFDRATSSDVYSVSITDHDGAIDVVITGRPE